MVLRRPRRRLLLSLGVLLLLLAIGVSFFWFYWLGPLRDYVHGEEDRDPFGLMRRWSTVQKRIRRTGWGAWDSGVV